MKTTCESAIRPLPAGLGRILQPRHEADTPKRHRPTSVFSRRWCRKLWDVQPIPGGMVRRLQGRKPRWRRGRLLAPNGVPISVFVAEPPI